MILTFKEFVPIIDNNTFIADNATVIGRTKIDKNASIWFNVVIRADVNKIIIGENTNIQDNTVIHCDDNHPTIIGKNVTVGHGAIVHGCTIKDNSLIGMGAIILDGAIVEENVIVGAGSLVSENKVIPKNSLVYGSPMKIVRNLSESEIESLKSSAEHYVELSKLYIK
ncbi:gamma carbonic anhydrase family protein [Helicovermis profundi]|uniref:Gamma carbonic anhydrase family protein n=1 Tax=Helicovermis profundi TaxID=3065157 RepID=A0AAU9E3H2_9FIRM|nr:gamma carbonic anhydrase family protein [Clostridia bacterium S502]